MGKSLREYAAEHGAPVPPVEAREMVTTAATDATKGQIEIFREYQDNIKKSERLRAKILKGAAAGVGAETLFLQAAEAISAMTGDKAFYRQIVERMEARDPGE